MTRVLRSSKTPESETPESKTPESETPESESSGLSDGECDNVLAERGHDVNSVRKPSSKKKRKIQKKPLDLKMTKTKKAKIPFSDPKLYYKDLSFDVLKLCVVILPKLDIDNLKIRIVIYEISF